MRSRQLFVFGLLVVAVVLSGSILAAFQLYKGTVAHHQRAELTQVADQVRFELDTRLADQQRTVELWASNPAVARHGTASQRDALRTFVDRTAFSGASVIAANGSMTGIAAGLSASERRALVGTSFADRTYFRRAMQGETYVSDPLEAESGNYIVTISTPIRRDGEVVGTLNAAFHLSKASFFTAVVTTLEPAQGLIVRSQSDEVIYERAPRPATDLVVRNATLAEVDWTVTVRESRSIIAPTIRRTTYVQFGALVVVLAGIAGFGWWNYRRNLQQVERLLAGFDALAAREYGVQVDVGGAEEWDRIGRGFNEMSRTLEQAFTERAERERQLQVLGRMLRHNLRNDLNVIRGRAETIVADATDPIAAHARQIIETSNGLLSMAEKERTIDKLLQEHPGPEPVDVVRVAHAAVEQARNAYPHADVEVDAPETLLAAAAPQLERAIEELIENAVVHDDDATPHVTVRITADDHVHVAVADEGPGIPEMERGVLAEDQDVDPLNHSTGLGLWLVYWVASHSDGQLRFAENDPRGSVVTLDLPRADEAEADSQQSR